MTYRDSRNLRNLNDKDPGDKKLQKRFIIILTIVWIILIYIIIVCNSCISTQSMIKNKNKSYHSIHYSKTYVGKYDTILVYATHYTKEQIAFLYLQNGNIIPIEIEESKIKFEFNDSIYKEEDFAIYFPNTGKRSWQRDIWEVWVLTPKKVPKYKIRLH